MQTTTLIAIILILQYNLFLKMGQTPPLFGLFLLYSQCKDKYSTNFTINDKSIDGVLGSQTLGGMMEGADESTELWRHPIGLKNLSNQSDCFKWTKHKFMANIFFMRSGPGNNIWPTNHDCTKEIILQQETGDSQSISEEDDSELSNYASEEPPPAHPVLRRQKTQQETILKTILP